MTKPKFNIGEYVFFKGTTGRKKRIFDWQKKPTGEFQDVHAQVFRVTDTMVEACYGGTQVHYNLRPMTFGHDGFVFNHIGAVSVERDLFKAREIELDPAPEAKDE